MAERNELGFPKESAGNLKHQLVRMTFHNVRSQGHPYVELREDGKKLIFFCTLCHAPCHSDSILFNHLKGKPHTERLTTAKITLLKQNPWPFSDGVFFFHVDLQEQNKTLHSSDSEQVKLLDTHNSNEDSLAIVSYANLGPNASTRISPEIEEHSDVDEIPRDFDLDVLVIPAVLQKNKVCDLAVRHMGVGKIGARFREKDGVSNRIHRMWCEWLGNKDLAAEDTDVVPEHDFAVVTFAYNCDLGRKGVLDSFRYLLPSSPQLEAEDSGISRGKKTKTFSEPEYVSNKYESSGEESQSSNNSNMKMLLSANDDQHVLTRILSSKTMRKELRGHQRVASERSCDICLQKMLPDKDVATLMNRKTGKLVCSSRNFTGAFHVFHISCLIHWILLCEVECLTNQSVSPKTKQRSKRKTIKRKADDEGGKCKMHETNKQIDSAFCPECQGTGITIDREELEKPCISLNEIFRCKIKLLDAHKAWMKGPELLDHCSMGFCFPLQSDETYKDNVASVKLLHFYRATD